MFEVTPIVKKIFWINVLTFFITLLTGDMIYHIFAQWHFNTEKFHLWQLVTHQFLHGGALHIIFNMLAFVSLAPSCEEYLGNRKFLPFYILSGIGAALLHMFMIDSNVPMVGASGAIFGILALFSIINSNEKLYLFLLPFGIKAKYFISILLIIEVLLGFFSTDMIGHFAHVGGAITGAFLFIINKYFLKNIY
jgi:membrane associated rhomboid family serine protease